MTVSQLIAMLKSQPGEAEVYYDYDEATRSLAHSHARCQP